MNTNLVVLLLFVGVAIIAFLIAPSLEAFMSWNPVFQWIVILALLGIIGVVYDQVKKK